MDTPSAPRPFRIDLVDGAPVVEVDGQDVTARIVGATVHFGYGQPTRLILAEDRPGSLSATGLVDAGGPSAAELIASLDPEEVENLALSIESDSTTMAANYIEAILQIVAR